ncbi:MAG: Gfo/Idh/MocA family oxidoreductase, partial [Armatimonadetes bacterium]|nr:Gfo/Idh/MocA family oxidoreductase [Armatimonadota bacterium]
DGSYEQWRWALPALEAGKPTFIDKPLAMNARDALQAIRVAERHNALLMSASSLRYVPDIQALKEEARQIGPIHLATTICGNELIYYGIHALEMAYEVLGSGATSVLNVGQRGRNICRVRFWNGHDLVLLVGERDYMQAGYQICLHGLRGWRTLAPNLSNLYAYLMQRFVEMVHSGVQPVPNREMHEVIAVLEAGVRSLEQGREVSLAEVMAEGEA